MTRHNTVAMTEDNDDQRPAHAPPVYTAAVTSVTGSDYAASTHRPVLSEAHQPHINSSFYPPDNKNEVPEINEEPKVLMTPEMQASSPCGFSIAGPNDVSLPHRPAPFDAPPSPRNPLVYPGDHKVQIPEYTEEPRRPMTPDSLVINSFVPELEEKREASVTPRGPVFNTPELPVSAPRVPSSGYIKSHSSIVLTGPLDIQGQVSSSSSINLSQHIHVFGKTHSSSSTQLSEHVTVDGKVQASGSVKCWDHVVVLEKVSASGSIDLRDGVEVGGKVHSSGSITLKNGVQVGDKVDASGSVTMDTRITVKGKASSAGSMTLKNGVSIAGDVSSSGKLRLDGPTGVNIGGKVTCSQGMFVETTTVLNAKLTVGGSLEVSASLHVKGDLDVLGNLILRRGANLEVDGKKKVLGKILKPDGPDDN